MPPGGGALPPSSALIITAILYEHFNFGQLFNSGVDLKYYEIARFRDLCVFCVSKTNRHTNPQATDVWTYKVLLYYDGTQQNIAVSNMKLLPHVY